MRASSESGGKGVLQFSQVGLSSSISPPLGEVPDNFTAKFSLHLDGQEAHEKSGFYSSKTRDRSLRSNALG
jgi:hypothetical protein